MLNDKDIKEYQEAYKKQYCKEISFAEASDQANRFYNFMEILYDSARKENYRKLKLKEFPKGYHLTEGTFSCCVCGVYVSGEKSWYDKHGIKCMFCQKAVEKKIIPSKACKDGDSWYSVSDITQCYNVRYATVHKYAREGKLKARIVLNEKGDPYFYLFLIKENPRLQNPKRTGTITRNGNTISYQFPEKLELVL
jgi:hypothetical protein